MLDSCCWVWVRGDAAYRRLKSSRLFPAFRIDGFELVLDDLLDASGFLSKMREAAEVLHPGFFIGGACFLSQLALKRFGDVPLALIYLD